MSAGGFFDARLGVLRDSADYVIVGSGAGGGAAARTLSKAGASVVVLEEGPLADTAKSSPFFRESMARLFRENGKMAAFGPATIPILQGRCVGGTTHVNSAIIWRLPEKVLHDWHVRFGLGEGLPQRALDDAAAVLEAEMHVIAVDDSGVQGENDRLLRLGAERAGIEHRYIHRSEQGCRGSARCLFGCPNDAKQSTALNYLRRAAADGAAVFANAKVERVVLEGGRAVAVVGRSGGKPFRVSAKRAVIVAASAVQSPNLLARSGVRGPELGRHFMAHPGSTVMGLYPDVVNMWLGAAQGYEAYGLRDTLGVKIESINVPPEVIAARLPGAGPRFAQYLERLDHVAAWSIAVRAEGEGRTRPSRLFGDLLTYAVTSRDLDRMRQGLKRAAEMHFYAGATEVLPGVLGLPDVITSPDELELFDDAPLTPAAYSMVATHLFGGCRAGSDAATSVVDPHLKVHGVDALYVMDASVFPTNTGVNPQHSIMSIASVAAARLASA